MSFPAAARRLAVLSDVHGNLVALQAVLNDAGAAGVDAIVVAGDSINFGPDSAGVVDLLRQRDAVMIRGNHEVELVATYDTPEMPPHVTSSAGFAPTRWTMEQLGPERRAFLAALPDQVWLDAATLVTHGSPRRVREGVHADRTDEELQAMLEGCAATTVFVGHTHRPLIRALPPIAAAAPRRFVNVGSVGFNLDENPRTCYALVERGPSGEPGDWQVTLRRVAYDTTAAVAAFDQGMRDYCPEFAEVFARQIRTGRRYFSTWLRTTSHLPEEELLPSLRRFLQENP